MLKQLRHKRFSKTGNEQLSLPGCYWYAQADKSSVLMCNEKDNKQERPDHIHT
jgi:hypothetical protein